MPQPLGTSFKMNITKNIGLIRTVIIVLSILLVGMSYLAFWIEGWACVFIFLGADVIGLFLIGFSICGIIIIFKNKNSGLITSLVIAVLAIFIVVFRPVEYIIEKLKSPVVLFAYCEHTVTNVSLKLRQDKTFEYNAGAFLSREIYHGYYNIIADTLVLNFNGNNNVNVRNKLLITDEEIIEIGDTTRHLHHFKITLNNWEK